MPDRYFVYILFSLKDRGLYIGYTTDLKKRLSQHQNSLVRSTAHRTPFVLVHYEYFIDRFDAKSREVFLKSGFGHREIKRFINRTLLSFQTD
jgi:putative endonuclease